METQIRFDGDDEIQWKIGFVSTAATLLMILALFIEALEWRRE
jgi:hypothetical protein